MNPLRLRARNYRTFAELELDLPAGCLAILGANGAGKSSIANIPDLCLFGPEGRSWAPYLSQGSESTELELELTFEHAGRLFKVRRGYSARGSGKTSLDLETLDPLALENVPLTKESQAETQAFLEEILGMTRETFRASSMLVQGDGAAFTEAKPAHRKEILGAVLGLSRYDDLLRLVKADRRTNEAAAQHLRGGLERADAELATREDVERKAKVEEEIVGLADKAHDDAERALAAAAAELRELEARRAARAEALVRVTEAAGKLGPLEKRLQEADEAAREIQVAEEEVATLTTPDQRADLERQEAELVGAVEAYRQAIRHRDEIIRTRELRVAERDAMTARVESLAAKAGEVGAKIEAIESGELDSCPTCQQALGAKAREETLGSLRARIVEMTDESRAIGEQARAIEVPPIPAEPTLNPSVEPSLAEIRRRLQEASAGDLQRERLAGRMQVLRDRVSARPEDVELFAARAEVDAGRAALDALPPAPDQADLDRVQAAALTARAEVESERLRYDVAKVGLARANAILERLAEVAKATAADRAKLAATQVELDALAILERAYGRDGIPSLIVQRVAIPAIETEAGRILAELGTSYRIELRTEKPRTDGTSNPDALDVVVYTEDGERPYETFSGGERTRINLAVRIALARLLAHRRGAESRLLVIDEPEFLDQAGTAALATVLRGLTGDFERVYLISHVPELRDALDACLEVVRDEAGLSTIGGTA